MAVDYLMIAVTETHLLEYRKIMLEIYEKLEAVAVLAAEANSLIEGGIYKGKALVELQVFFNYLKIHVDKLELLYSVGAAYIQNTYDTFKEVDELTGLELNQLIGQ